MNTGRGFRIDHSNVEKTERNGPPLFVSESGRSTPVPLPDLYSSKAKYPGLDMKQTSTGVIWSTEQANSKGYTQDDPGKYEIFDT